MHTSLIDFDMAWDIDARPSKIAFMSQVPQDYVSEIVDVVSTKIPIRKYDANVTLLSLKPGTDLAGHYMLKTDYQKWFLRITRRSRKNIKLETEISKYLMEMGLAVNHPLCSDISLVWKGTSFSLSIYSFIEGRHFDGSDEDLEKVGLAIKKMHDILKSAPFSDIVFRSALQAAKRLEAVRTKIKVSLENKDFALFCEREEWAKRNQQWLWTMVSNFNPYMCRASSAQCVHGELHLGNIIFSKKTGRVIFTDFEETPDAWYSPSFDLAYIIHRYCMDRNPSQDLFDERLAGLERSYGPLPGDLRGIMRNICWYNIALITERLYMRQSIVPEAEYDKFVTLDEKTLKYM